MRLELRYDYAAARAAIRKAPDVFSVRLAAALQRGARAIAKEARNNVGKRHGMGTLLQSIQPRQLGPLHWEVRPSEAYAIIVEMGSGPAAGRAKYYPNPDRLKDWLTLNPRYRGHKWAAPGTAKRSSQALDIWFRSRAMAWGIYQKGTKAYPFMQPAFEAKKDEVLKMANEEIRKAVAEINGGGRVA